MTAKHSLFLNVPVDLYNQLDLFCQIQDISKTSFMIEAIKRQLDMYRNSSPEDLLDQHKKNSPFYDWCKAYFAFASDPDNSVFFNQYKALSFQMEEWAKEYNRLKKKQERQ